MTIYFEEVVNKGRRTVIDPTGKKHQVTRTFSQTINPYNRDANGNVKSKQQISKEISAEYKEWMALDNDQLWEKEQYRFKT